MEENINEELKNGAKKLGKKAFKGAGKLAGAAALGTFGLAAGIATGDLSNVTKYAGAGALAEWCQSEVWY